MGQWLRLGDLELLVVSDGVLRQDAGAVFGLTPRVMWEPYVPELDGKHRLPMGLNCMVVRGEGKTVLVETGVGTKASRLPGAAVTEGSGALLRNLEREGIRPEDVDIVVNTHLHFDHAGGNTLISEGKPVPAFPRARYLIQKGEWRVASSPNERTRATYLAENFEPLEDARQVELVEGEVEVIKGLRLVPAPGHTADHCIVELDSGGELALYVGELAQQPVMLERIAWISAFDILPLVSLETKKRVIERALERRALIVSVHAPYPGLGRLRLEDSRRRWEPLARNGQ
ncbi:MAG: MBL fold metallo-hydrolase [Chloroflexi bacterium]|nr:MBL fold metallo-hydrolase [Chloroflexota bacterium]